MNETWTGGFGRSGQCPVPDPTKRGQSVAIVNGTAQWTDVIGREYEGTDSPKGQLTMHSMVPGDLYREVTVRGVLEGNGTVPARFISRRCSYHHVFQKETK